MIKIKLITILLFITLVTLAQQEKVKTNTLGTPIGGIIVKGGKNPGGQMFTVVTNDKGLAEINNLEAGNYTLTLTSPASAAGPAAKAPGGPIGGIIVKGGKNPGGQFFSVITNEKGQVNVDISEAGNYIIQVSYPDTDNDDVIDIEDNCKFTYNPDQLDTDNDGIGDVAEIINRYNSGIVLSDFKEETFNTTTESLLKQKPFDPHKIRDGAQEYYDLNIAILKYKEIYELILNP